MQGESWKAIRGESHSPVNARCPVRVVLERGTETPSSVEAELMDLAPGGARLVLDVAVQFQEMVTLRLEGAKLKRSLSASAKVCWIRKTDDDRWALGVSFSPALPEERLDELYSSGLLERRRNPRRSFHAPALARWELTPEPVAVEMLDVSLGGFSVQSPCSAKFDSRMRLTIEDGEESTVDISGRVRWEAQVGDGYMIGCEFTGHGGYTQLRDAIAYAEAREVPRIGPKRKLSIISAAGVAAVLWVYWVFLVL